MLGSIDDIVSPEDQIDLETGGNFVYLGVRYSGHADIIQMGSVDADEFAAKSALRLPRCSLAYDLEQIL